MITRKWTPGDRAYVLETWSRSARSARDYRAIVPLAAAALGRVDVVIACLPDTPEVILGWAASIEDRVVWLYVKGLYVELAGDEIVAALTAGKRVSHATKSR